jgi:hypothetical protein
VFWPFYFIFVIANAQAVLIHLRHFFGCGYDVGVYINVELPYSMLQLPEVSDLAVDKALRHDAKALPDSDLRS